MKKINALPTGPGWECEYVEVLGDRVDGDGKLMEEKLELWKRNPVDCIKDLLQNPAFKEHMAYAPERVYRDEAGKRRVYDEMWTADWWWTAQVQIVMHKHTLN
jgi:Plavaka transposase